MVGSTYVFIYIRNNGMYIVHTLITVNASIIGLQNNSGLVIVTSSVSFLCIVFEDDKLRSWWTNIMA
jgi:hypothetical protein